MDSDALVRSLVDDLRPVRRLPGVEARAARWAGVAAGLVAAGAVAGGLRTDLVQKLIDPGYLAETAALLVLFVSSARAAFQLSVPGAERGRWVPLGALLAWILLVVSRWTPVAWTDGWHCVAGILGLAIASGAPILVMLRRAAPHERAWTGLLAVLSAGALGVLGTQVACATDDPAHVLVWHVGPLLVAALAGLGAGRLFLRR